MKDIGHWGDVTLIVHTDDGIMEFGGPVPAGEVARGYYNVPGSKGFHGHLRHERCAGIAFVERPFMGRLSASVLFFNVDGGIMFKVFVGRDEKRELKAEQLDGLPRARGTPLRALGGRLKAVSCRRGEARDHAGRRRDRLDMARYDQAAVRAAGVASASILLICAIAQTGTANFCATERTVSPASVRIGRPLSHNSSGTPRGMV